MPSFDAKSYVKRQDDSSDNNIKLNKWNLQNKSLPIWYNFMVNKSQTLLCFEQLSQEGKKPLKGQ